MFYLLLKRTVLLYILSIFTNRRIKEFGLKEEVPENTDIPSDDLNKMVSEIYREFPNCGIRRMKGFLMARGVKLQWERVRSSLWRIDPDGILLKSMQLSLVNRRKNFIPIVLMAPGWQP